jgi:homoserine dehydrogenase|tara:strand:+ start:1209 stop:2231 length:1023 start_codon:yes stop_codon:yes gene_type:complete
MRIILIGFGTVGKSVCELLIERKEELVKKHGFEPRVIAITDTKGAVIDEKGLNLKDVLEAKKKSSVANIPEKGIEGKSSKEVIEELDAEVVIETTPTDIESGEPAMSHIETAFKTKKHIITANKGPFAIAYPALMDLAKYNNKMLKFSAAVGGGTPMLEFGKKCLEADRITQIDGILNGTTNYILSEMDQKGISFDQALQQAKELGYAEADPKLDINGSDAAAKLVIMANFLLGKEITLKDLEIEGITNITSEDIVEAKKENKIIKLVARIGDTEKEKPCVKPIKLERTDPMAVLGALNSVKFVSEFAGEEIIIGKGAGGHETASSILRDLLDIKNNMMV